MSASTGLPASFSWSASAPLVSPASDAGHAAAVTPASWRPSRSVTDPSPLTRMLPCWCTCCAGNSTNATAPGGPGCPGCRPAATGMCTRSSASGPARSRRSRRPAPTPTCLAGSSATTDGPGRSSRRNSKGVPGRQVLRAALVRVRAGMWAQDFLNDTPMGLATGYSTSADASM